MLFILEAGLMYQESEVTGFYILCAYVRNYRKGNVADLQALQSL